MRIVLMAALVAGFYPLARALRANRATTLVHACGWLLAAWAAWIAAAVVGPGVGLLAYLAVCLTGCAGVAVLGARRPGAAAWNAVVVGLLAVLLRPAAEGLGELRLTEPHLLFVVAVLAVGVGNYLPTRLGPAVVLAAAGCGLELAALTGYGLGNVGENTAWGLLAAAPWVVLLGLYRRTRPATAGDALWLAHRDRFGLVWAQRMREQFNRAAANAGYPVVLSWSGLQASPGGKPNAADGERALALLQGVLRRFRRDDAAAP